MEFSEKTTMAIESCKLDTLKIERLSDFVKSDRFSYGFASLENWLEIGDLFNRISQDKSIKRNDRVSIFEELLGMEIAKDERATSLTLSQCDHAHVKAWYVKENKFMVSPRTILKAYTAYQLELTPKAVKDAVKEIEEQEKEKSEKSDFQKIIEHLTDTRKLVETAQLSAKEYKLIVGFTAGIDATIKGLTNIKMTG